MQLTNTLFAFLVASATALPSQLHKRSAGSVLLCTGANFTGTCTYLSHPINTCVDLPTNLTKSVSAINPDAGAECMLMQGHCNDEEPYHGEIVTPGIADLSTVGFDNKATSYLCLEQL